MAHRVSEDDARAFVTRRYGAFEELTPLGGGAWSSAYSFLLAGRPLVIRFGARRDWFEAERAAMAFDSPEIPVPEVLEVGEAFGGAYVISARFFGTFLEQVRSDQSEVAGPMLASLLGALFSVPKSPDLPVGWHWLPSRSDLTWRDWLWGRIGEDSWQETRGSRAALRAHGGFDRLFTSCEARFRQLVDACPERRDLIHGDLLHSNVLVSEDASYPVAVFSWKTSVRGDFLFETAWCTFCSCLYPGIAALDVWGLVHQQPSMRAYAEAFIDAPLRHHCYELNIGLRALTWNAWIGDEKVLEQVAAHLAMLFERGPLPALSA